MKQADYCKQHNISIASFGSWRTKLKRETTEIKQTKKLLPLTPLTISKPSNIIQVSLPNGIQMNVPIQLLAETLDVLSNHQQAVSQ